MISTTVRPLEEYDIKFDNSCRVFVDDASPSFITTLKQAVNEDRDYVMKIAYHKKNYPSVYNLQFLQQNFFIIPVPFSKEHKAKLAHTEELMEYRQGYVAIHPRHYKLITDLRTAVKNGEVIR